VTAFNEQIIDEFRKNQGHVTSYHFATMPLLLLHSRGAKTGKPTVAPVARFEDGNSWLIVGSAGGSPKHPAWVHNLRANPEARIELGTDELDVAAEELDGDEYGRAWRKVVAEQPAFEGYLAKTDRKLPVIRLSRR
jgi:deazaflavin-dependent oxidoreductase (nitroreductase family)